jgi:metal-responsive CopG/Arc/MetJ family transcriptional regulator
MTRIQLELPEEKVKELEELMENAGIKTKKELFNNALTLLEWAIKEKKTGRKIASINEEEDKYKEVVIPGLL